MSLNQSETTMAPCAGCSRQVRIPSGKLRAHMRIRPESPYIVFCSAKCQNMHIAKTGATQQEEILRGER